MGAAPPDVEPDLRVHRVELRPLVRYGGRRSHLERVAFLSSLVFGITFVGAYTGIAHAVFSI
jgi:hypothetical protein